MNEEVERVWLVRMCVKVSRKGFYVQFSLVEGSRASYFSFDGSVRPSREMLDWNGKRDRVEEGLHKTSYD